MRDIWDKTTIYLPHPRCLPGGWREGRSPIGFADGPLREKKEAKEIIKHRILPPDIEKYRLDYLARRRTFLKTKDEITKIFADYEKRLGDAGFSKIWF